MRIRRPPPHGGWIALWAAFLTGFSGTSCMRATPPVPSGTPNLECSLAAEGSAEAEGPVSIRFTLTNRGTAPVFVLRWYTPLEGVRSDLFTITRLAAESGPSRLDYQGPLVKRANPGKDDYLEIAPGRSVAESVDLAPAYGLKEAGSYEVQFERGLSDQVVDPAELPRKSEAHRPFPLACAPLRIEVAPAARR